MGCPLHWSLLTDSYSALLGGQSIVAHQTLSVMENTGNAPAQSWVPKPLLSLLGFAVSHAQITVLFVVLLSFYYILKVLTVLGLHCGA